MDSTKQILPYLECLNRILIEYNTGGRILNTTILYFTGEFNVNVNASSMEEFGKLKCFNNAEN